MQSKGDVSRGACLATTPVLFSHVLGELAIHCFKGKKQLSLAYARGLDHPECQVSSLIMPALLQKRAPGEATQLKRTIITCGRTISQHQLFKSRGIFK